MIQTSSSTVLARLGFVFLAAGVLSACGSGGAEQAASGGSGSNTSGSGASGGGDPGSVGGGSTTPDGLVISHVVDGNVCATYYGKAKANSFLPSELGPCPPRSGVVCAKCEDQYPIVTFAVDGIRSRDEIFSLSSVEACVSWAAGSTRADVCEVERQGKFTAVAPGVAGPSGLSRPAVVPGTPTEGLGPWQFSLLGFKIDAGTVKLPDCVNYYGNGVTDDMRWRGSTVPCPDANRVRTAPKPFVLEEVTAEYVYYAD